MYMSVRPEITADVATRSWLVSNKCSVRDINEKRLFLALKRSLDLGGALILIAIGWPIIFAVAVIVALDVGSPVLFRQVRTGRHGAGFEIYKFRTMGRLGEPASRIGRWLRRSRLDELPQLYNVLKGDMALVGPRPLLAGDLCPGNLHRLRVRPGLTGWAQIQGGRDLDAADKAALDAWYVRHASLALDLLVLARTLPSVARGDTRNEAAIAAAWRELSGTGAFPDRRTTPRYVALGAANTSGRSALFDDGTHRRFG